MGANSYVTHCSMMVPNSNCGIILELLVTITCVITRHLISFCSGFNNVSYSEIKPKGMFSDCSGTSKVRSAKVAKVESLCVGFSLVQHYWDKEAETSAHQEVSQASMYEKQHVHGVATECW